MFRNLTKSEPEQVRNLQKHTRIAVLRYIAQQPTRKQKACTVIKVRSSLVLMDRCIQEETHTKLSCNKTTFLMQVSLVSSALTHKSQSHTRRPDQTRQTSYQTLELCRISAKLEETKFCKLVIFTEHSQRSVSCDCRKQTQTILSISILATANFHRIINSNKKYLNKWQARFQILARNHNKISQIVALWVFTSTQMNKMLSLGRTELPEEQEGLMPSANFHELPMTYSICGEQKRIPYF